MIPLVSSCSYTPHVEELVLKKNILQAREMGYGLKHMLCMHVLRDDPWKLMVS